MRDRTATLHCFKRWKIKELEMFEARQWIFLVPYFDRDPKDFGKVQQYLLPDSATLPFTIFSKVPGTRNHFSQLFKAKVHKDHHNIQSDMVEDYSLKEEDRNVFAIKELTPNAYANPRDELLALRLVNKTAHPHLIMLLASYQQFGNIYLIFPWAKCYLDAFWKEHDPQNDHTIRYWAVRQFEGLASGLAAIHSFRVRSDDSIFSRNIELFCRHGDIKPQNILWFSHADTDRGILKLADFGTAEVKAEEAAHWKSYAWTQTYRPPESYNFTLPREDLVSTSYDIWSLGCVLLEFITWLFGGPAALDQFVTDRRHEDQSTDAHLQVGTAFFALSQDYVTGEPIATATIRP
ncbi:kinase-like domain-containing protein [Triangularia verruculosa]|uniref:Kinase-like domain-containing protein n=1 Tax=Triangularia verruculosa TaxID=2587418 RepID=A0AAN7B0K2_9PEZI|nr:kinase-like domain-containing protein [Triangularia verruculosa]